MPDLRRHPVGRPDEALPLAQGGRDLRRDAKVRQLHLAPVREEDVGTLDVPVHLAHGVEVGQALKRLAAHEGDLLLRQGTRD